MSGSTDTDGRLITIDPFRVVVAAFSGAAGLVAGVLPTAVAGALPGAPSERCCR